jgi:hypothetical protein
MKPTDVGGKTWAADTSQFALQKIRAKAQADLDARDERRSQGQLNKANKYSPYREVKDDRGTGSTFQVDPVLSTLRCTGEELTNLTCKRWAEFCAEPRDEKPYAEELLQATRDKVISMVQASGQSVEDSLTVGAEPAALLPEKPKPKKKEPVLIG